MLTTLFTVVICQESEVLLHLTSGGKMNGIEKEVKYSLSVREARRIKSAMTKICDVSKKTIEVTAIYDDEKLSCLKTGKTLRIRIICLLFPGTEWLRIQSASLDYKGPSSGKKINIREEYSAPLTNYLQIIEASKMLRAKGFNCIFFYTKEKEEWPFFGTKVSIDDLFFLGKFLEIEGSEERIAKIIEALDLTAKEMIPKTTYQLYGRFFEIYGRVPPWMIPSIRFI